MNDQRLEASSLLDRQVRVVKGPGVIDSQRALAFEDQKPKAGVFAENTQSDQAVGEAATDEN